jgi:hypothetical protein
MHEATVVLVFDDKQLNAATSRPNERLKNKSCILFTEFNSPPNLVRDKGIYSTRSGSNLTSAEPTWDLRAQLMEHEGEDQWVQGWELMGRRSGV